MRISLGGEVGRRQGAGVRITAAIRMFRLQDAGCAGTEDDRHTMGAIALPGGLCGLNEPILLESEEREPVIPAVEPLQFRRR